VVLVLPALQVEQVALAAEREASAQLGESVVLVQPVPQVEQVVLAAEREASAQLGESVVLVLPALQVEQVALAAEREASAQLGESVVLVQLESLRADERLLPLTTEAGLNQSARTPLVRTGAEARSCCSGVFVKLPSQLPYRALEVWLCSRS
jgi:hypothetical protein